MGIYVKQSGKPWTTKKIAGNPIGDVALDIASTNNIQNKPVAKKFSAVDTAISNEATARANAIQSEATARANADNTKVNKAGDTMTGMLTLRGDSPMLQLCRYAGNTNARQLYFFMDSNSNAFTAHDYVGGSFVGVPLAINADSRIVWSQYNLDLYGEFHAKSGMVNEAGWFDFYFNNQHRMAFFCNNNDRADVWWSPAGDRLEMRTTGGIELKTNVSCSVGTMDWSRGVPLRAGSFEQFSSRLIKENIQSMTDDDGLKVLKLNPVHFDFKEKFGGEKNNIGLIAEETLNIIPEIVNVPDDYDESEFDEDKGLNNKLLAIDYVKLTPYLVKLCQMQQKQIENLSARIDALEKIIN